MPKNLKDKRQNEECFAMVGMDKTRLGELNVKVVGRESEREISSRIFKSAKEFVADIPKFFTSKFKAILFFCDLEPSDFKNNLEFCKAVKAALNDLGIPHYFINPNEYIASHMLINAAVDIKLGETIIFLIVCSGYVSLAERQYTINGYEVTNLNIVQIDSNGDPHEMCDAIMGTSNPQKILLLRREEGQATCKFLKSSVLKSKRSMVAEVDINVNPKFIVELAKWVLDKTYTKYYVAPLCNRPVKIIAPFKKTPLIETSCSENVPLEKFAYVYKVNGLVTSTYTSFQLRQEVPILFFLPAFIIGALELPQQCHRVKITLNIDAENFPSLKYVAIALTNIRVLPQLLNENMKEKVPVIGFYDDCYVICVYNEVEKNYKFLDAWNGEYGKALAMSFDAPKPLFGSNVYGKMTLNPASVVYDLIKIMAIQPENIQVDERWPFKVTQDEKKQLLIEYSNYGGTQRAATPTFVMAIFLKEHIKSVKNECGQDYKEFGFYCFHNFTKEEQARVKNQLRESLELLKMKCVSGLFASR